MKRELIVRQEKWPLAVPFKITGHSWTHVEAVVVEVKDGAASGRGEASGIYYCCETQESMTKQIESAREPIEAGVSREDLLRIMPTGGARNAVDCALWDLEAKMSGNSVSDLTGIPARPLTTVFTISIKPEIEEMAEIARQHADFPVLKVKLDSELPVERMEAIRQARPDATLIIDANQGFSFQQLKEVLPAFAKLNIAMVEQPLPRGQDELLEGFKPPIPICADESILDSSEFAQAARRYQMINIKLDKTGGLTEALNVLEMAQKREIPTMVGNMFGTSLAMAPAFLIGQACKFVDLDGPLHLEADRALGLSFNKSQISLPDEPLWG